MAGHSRAGGRLHRLRRRPHHLLGSFGGPARQQDNPPSRRRRSRSPLSGMGGYFRKSAWLSGFQFSVSANRAFVMLESRLQPVEPEVPQITGQSRDSNQKSAWFKGG